jgi:uncharacterized protein YcnI
MTALPRPLAVGLAAGAGIALALAAPLAASAHISLETNTAEAGSTTLLTFTVPNESAVATTALELTLPADTPFESISVVPVPGWTAAVTDTTITWTADTVEDGVADGEMQLFTISVGPVPDTGSITLPVSQTSSDGSTVAWADAADGAKPAPVLYVNDTPPADHHGGTAAEDGGEEGDGAEVTAAPAAEPDVLGRVFGIGGLALGAAALVVVLLRRPNRPVSE